MLGGAAPRLGSSRFDHEEPPAVGREVKEFLAAAGPERPRPAARRDLPGAAVDVGKRPDIHLELAGVVRFVGEPAAVGRDGGYILQIGTLGEPLDRISPVGRLPVEVPRPAPLRAEDHTTPVRGPRIVVVQSRIERETREGAAREVPNPNILFLIGDAECDARAVG